MNDLTEAMKRMEKMAQVQQECIQQAIKEHGPRNGWIKQEAVQIFEMDGQECWIIKPSTWDSFDMLHERGIALDFHPGYCGYAVFHEKPVKEAEHGGILTYVPVHGGITYTWHDELGSVYGFDTAHAHSSQVRARDLEWIRGQINVMVRGILLAAAVEDEYLAAEGDNRKRAELVQPILDIAPGPLNFQMMLNLLSGKL